MEMINLCLITVVRQKERHFQTQKLGYDTCNTGTFCVWNTPWHLTFRVEDNNPAEMNWIFSVANSADNNHKVVNSVDGYALTNFDSTAAEDILFNNTRNVF